MEGCSKEVGYDSDKKIKANETFTRCKKNDLLCTT
jgi:hypothetical protein